MDQHATLSDAREMAAKEAVGMAVSNPCFELWCLLHFDDQNAHCSPGSLIRALRKYIPEYDKGVEYDDLRDRYGSAVKRATTLRDEANRHHEPGRNPTTDVDLLTKSLKKAD